MAALAVAVGTPILLGWGLVFGSSPTFDEPIHLAAGYEALAAGHYNLNNIGQPPLAEMWAAIPLLALRPDHLADNVDLSKLKGYGYGDAFLYHNRVPALRLLRAARLWNLVTLNLLLGSAVVLWARRFGPVAGAGSAAAFAFCTPWVSNAALVTADSLSSALFFLSFAVLGSSVDGGFRRWALVGAAVGAALASKFNMILLPPLIGLIAWLDAGRQDKRLPYGPMVMGGVVSVVVLLAAYRVVHARVWVEEFGKMLSWLSHGRRTYLLGLYSSTGWWAYFPVAVLVKTPVPILAMAAMGAWHCWRRNGKERIRLLLPPLAYFLVAMSSRTQIGLRHVLLIYPFLCVCVGVACAQVWRIGRRGRLALAVLCLWLAVSVLRVHPHYLSYFNEFSGGPAVGGRWLVDANLDWGQDLPALARELARRGNPPVVLAYFGTADPAAEGIRYIPMAMVSMIGVDRPGNAALTPADPVLLAVSETNRVGLHYPDRGMFAWLADIPPVARPGWSMALYDLTRDAPGRDRLAALLAFHGREHDAAAVASPRRPRD